MSDYIGSRKQVDEYIGSRLVVAGYQGSRKYFDAFDTVSGALPLTFDSRVQQVLRNYAVYGSASGAGVETENLLDFSLLQFGYTLNAAGEIIEFENRSATIQPITYSGITEATLEYSSLSTTTKYVIYAVFNSGTLVRRVSGIRTGDILDLSNGNELYVSFYTVASLNDVNNVMLVPGSTAPASYIPYGYQIPLTNTGVNSQSETYHLYIGSTKLGAEEYVDYEAGKIYKMTGGVLTPTDPAAPLPAIRADKGNNTISSAETLSSISVTGRINV